MDFGSRETPEPAAPPRPPAISESLLSAAHGSTTRKILPDEMVRARKGGATARPATPRKPADADERTVAWIWCDPMPPFPLGLAPIVRIGRSKTSDLVLPHPGVSRLHALVMVSGDRLVLEDRSTHGTYVNGNRVTTATIAPGDDVVIGPYELKICSRAIPHQQHAASEDDTRGFEPPKLAKVDEHAMSGRLETQPMVELLQGLEFNSRSGTLSVQYHEIVGELVLVDGQPVRAFLGSILGEMAIHALLSLDRGSYSFVTSVKAGERNIHKKLMTIMLDASRAMDEEE
jgi:hypothetical protein